MQVTTKVIQLIGIEEPVNDAALALPIGRSSRPEAD
jgi:hypothetical protein